MDHPRGEEYSVQIRRNQPLPQRAQVCLWWPHWIAKLCNKPKFPQAQPPRPGSDFRLPPKGRLSETSDRIEPHFGIFGRVVSRPDTSLPQGPVLDIALGSVDAHPFC